MENIHSILEEVILCPQKAILATIINVDGSAYRKEGTTMLVKEDGSRNGLLSGGCLEEDIAARLEEVWENGPRTIEYDMRGFNELSWGEAAGCNGVIYVLLEPIYGKMRTYLTKLQNSLNNGQEVTVVKKLPEQGKRGGTLYWTEDNQLYGSWQGEIYRDIKEAIQEAFTGELPALGKSGMILPNLSRQPVFLQHFKPKPKLYVFGANPDAVPVVKLAAEVGFSVLVSDWRPAFCTKIRFPWADECIVGFPDEVLSELTFTSQDYVLLLTHHFEMDKELLSVLVDQELRYLAVLGSRSRTSRLLESEVVPDNVTSPAGLSIGAEGPEEIAVSIVSQLIMRSKATIPRNMVIS
ncbi:XdhC family protein [Alteribacillus sp. HJP-4]|uniref:XdhC family protein n=1 Tax=Alteribacillus sp. HJP-4 TaxID=2775394 RepID=UPI0035CD0D84